MWDIRMSQNNQTNISKSKNQTPQTKYKDIRKIGLLFSDKPTTFYKRKLNRMNIF